MVKTHGILKVARIHPLAHLPKYATDGSVGLDLCAVDRGYVASGETAIIGTGVAIELPTGFEAQVRPRSGLASRGIVAQLGTVDTDYRGEVKVIIRNESGGRWEYLGGDRIAQLVVAPVARVAVVDGELSSTARGAGGLGSTGR